MDECEFDGFHVVFCVPTFSVQLISVNPADSGVSHALELLADKCLNRQLLFIARKMIKSPQPGRKFYSLGERDFIIIDEDYSHNHKSIKVLSILPTNSVVVRLLLSLHQLFGN